MGKVYASQPFKIELTYSSLPAVPVSQQIFCKDPSGLTTTLDASINTVSHTIYHYSTTNETLETPGLWTFWARITDEFGQIYPSEPFQVPVYTEGEILETVLVSDQDPLHPVRFIRKTLY